MKDGRLEDAKKTFEIILATLVKEFGEENRRVGAALHNLAIVHLRSGNMTDAVDAIEEAVRIRKSTLGEFHPKVSVSLNNSSLNPQEYGILIINKPTCSPLLVVETGFTSRARYHITFKGEL